MPGRPPQKIVSCLLCDIDLPPDEDPLSVEEALVPVVVVVAVGVVVVVVVVESYSFLRIIILVVVDSL